MSDLVVCRLVGDAVALDYCLVCRGPFVVDGGVCADCRERLRVRPQRDGGRGKRRGPRLPDTRQEARCVVCGLPDRGHADDHGFSPDTRQEDGT